MLLPTAPPLPDDEPPENPEGLPEEDVGEEGELLMDISAVGEFSISFVVAESVTMT